jgi:hypothetical protein
LHHALRQLAILAPGAGLGRQRRFRVEFRPVEKSMSSEPLRIERRHNQRFNYHLPVSIRMAGSDHEGHGYTQDLSARGVLLFTDFPLAEGNAVELTLQMPSEITLGEAMRVRCYGLVKRVMASAAGTAHGVAVQLERYEYLPDADQVRSSGVRNSGPLTESRPVLHS